VGKAGLRPESHRLRRQDRRLLCRLEAQIYQRILESTEGNVAVYAARRV